MDAVSNLAAAVAAPSPMVWWGFGGAIVVVLWPIVRAALFRLWCEIRPPTSFAEFRGDWALVTGASRGLGRGYALALARRGINLHLVARTKDALESVAKECEELGVQTRVHVFDFSTPDIESMFAPLAEHVAIVVNNVGGLPPASLPTAPNPSLAEDIDGTTFESYLRFNALTAVHLNSVFLRSMIKKKKGYILNVSSMNGLQAVPFLGPYCASKAFINAYSACLANELRGRNTGVWVDTVCPGPVATDGIRLKGRPRPGIPDPCEYAEKSLSLARTPGAQMPWLRHWWDMQAFGPNSLFLSDVAGQRRLYGSYARMIGLR
jgi:short-subunit dehydrogenase